jgi:hypothetical protein
MTDKKELKVEFAPGCFDHFDGTQEELDGLLAEIQNMFANKTAEELEAMSRPLTEEDFDELPDDVKQQLMQFDEDDIGNNTKRRLQ